MNSDQADTEPNPTAEQAAGLLERIHARSAEIGVIGMGYVGLPLALTTAQAGFSVTGFDVDEEKVGALNGGRSYIAHIESGTIAEARQGGKFRATSHFAELAKIDLVLICVPTPLTPQREPDMRFVERTACQIADRLRPGLAKRRPLFDRLRSHVRCPVC